MPNQRLKPLAPFGAIAKASSVVFAVLAILFVVGHTKRYLVDNNERTTQNQVVNAQGNEDPIQGQGDGSNSAPPTVASQEAANDSLFRRELDENADEYDGMDIDPAVEIKDRVCHVVSPSLQVRSRLVTPLLLIQTLPSSISD